MRITMREILFRGKRVDNGNWVKGSLCTTIPESDNWYTISYFDNEGYYCEEKVIPETIGQYTGLNDKNGTKIFEGDIIKSKKIGSIGVIKFGIHYNKFKDVRDIGFYIDWVIGGCKDGLRRDLGYWTNERNDVYIIGNIHDNPELLEVSK